MFGEALRGYHQREHLDAVRDLEGFCEGIIKEIIWMHSDLEGFCRAYHQRDHLDALRFGRLLQGILSEGSFGCIKKFGRLLQGIISEIISMH
jgi:hypothetical protein